MGLKPGFFVIFKNSEKEKCEIPVVTGLGLIQLMRQTNTLPSPKRGILILIRAKTQAFMNITPDANPRF
jgi:hypothetical protein